MSPIFEELIKYAPKHILHVGGHKGQEGKVYEKLGCDFTFVEPVPKFAKIIRNKGYKVIETSIDLERGTSDFYVNAQTSSFNKRSNDDKFNKVVIKVNKVKLSDIEGEFDILVVDTEGNDLRVLKSASQLNYKVIICEGRSDKKYNIKPTKKPLEDYLLKQKYSKVLEVEHTDKEGQGKQIWDMLFVRNG